MVGKLRQASFINTDISITKRNGDSGQPCEMPKMGPGPPLGPPWGPALFPLRDGRCDDLRCDDLRCVRFKVFLTYFTFLIGWKKGQHFVFVAADQMLKKMPLPHFVAQSLQRRLHPYDFA